MNIHTLTEDWNKLYVLKYIEPSDGDVHKQRLKSHSLCAFHLASPNWVYTSPGIDADPQAGLCL